MGKRFYHLQNKKGNKEDMVENEYVRGKKYEWCTDDNRCFYGS